LLWNSRLAVVTAVAIALIVPGAQTAGAAKPAEPTVTELATFVDGPCTDGICGAGSTIGPDGALYVTDSTRGRIQRIDLTTGRVSTYADGLPQAIAGVVGGGVADIVFLGGTAYVLVNGVSEFWTELVGSSNVPAAEGIYRLDSVGVGTTQATLIADIYTWSEDNPPDDPQYFIPGGYTYAMERYGRGFLVTDGHHNRVLRVGTNGDISVFHDFAANVVPTGLETHGGRVLVGQAGPVPHIPEEGVLVALRRKGGAVTKIASGAPLLVDVEIGRGNRIYGLAQGDWPYEGQEGKEGFPASPDTGHLMVADRNGQFQSVVAGLDQPATFEIIKDTAYVVTLTGKVLHITGLRP
jgi:hypothetical protein